MAVDRLGVQDLVVAQRHRVFGERNHLRVVEWKLPDDRRHLGDQTTQVVRVLKLDSPRPEHSLEPLLNGLLSVETNNLVADLRVGQQTHCVRVLFCLADENFCFDPRITLRQERGLAASPRGPWSREYEPSDLRNPR